MGIALLGLQCRNDTYTSNVVSNAQSYSTLDDQNCSATVDKAIYSKPIKPTFRGKLELQLCRHPSEASGVLCTQNKQSRLHAAAVILQDSSVPRRSPVQAAVNFALLAQTQTLYVLAILQMPAMPCNQML